MFMNGLHSLWYGDPIVLLLHSSFMYQTNSMDLAMIVYDYLGLDSHYGHDEYVKLETSFITQYKDSTRQQFCSIMSNLESWYDFAVMMKTVSFDMSWLDEKLKKAFVNIFSRLQTLARMNYNNMTTCQFFFVFHDKSAALLHETAFLPKDYTRIKEFIKPLKIHDLIRHVNLFMHGQMKGFNPKLCNSLTYKSMQTWMESTPQNYDFLLFAEWNPPDLTQMKALKWTKEIVIDTDPNTEKTQTTLKIKIKR